MRYSPPPELEGGLDKHNKRGGFQSGKVSGLEKKLVFEHKDYSVSGSQPIQYDTLTI